MCSFPKIREPSKDTPDFGKPLIPITSYMVSVSIFYPFSLVLHISGVIYPLTTPMYISQAIASDLGLYAYLWVSQNYAVRFWGSP